MYSTNYEELDSDVYKIEVWNLIKDVLRLLDCDVKKLEDQVFPTIIDDDDDGISEHYDAGYSQGYIDATVTNINKIKRFSY
jgi:hypothetical protein